MLFIVKSVKDEIQEWAKELLQFIYNICIF